MSVITCDICGAHTSSPRKHKEWHQVQEATYDMLDAHVENLIQRVYELEGGDAAVAPDEGGHVKWNGQCVVDCPHPSHIPPACTCGHEAAEHFRSIGNCMAETEESTWACDCDEYEAAT
jgi:hypothetical protein